MIRPGRYRHYKGCENEVIGIARHSKTEDKLVIYRTSYGDRSLWVKPLEMFAEDVLVKGQTVARFVWAKNL